MHWPDDNDERIPAFLDIVVEDLIEGLAELFEPPDRNDPRSAVVFADEVSADLPLSDSFAAVPWQWVGTHTGNVDDLPEDSPGRGSPVRKPTGRIVVIDGLSLLQRTADAEVFVHRYIDWLGAYSQLGVLMAGRTPFSPRVPSI